jgi:TolB-like protein
VPRWRTSTFCAAVVAVSTLAIFPTRNSSAAEPPKIAILEFDIAKGLDIDRIYFSDKVRGVVRERAPNLFVRTRESVQTILAASSKVLADCDDECEVETGRKLGANYVVSGRLTKVGSRVALTMRLFNTGDAQLLASNS